jgi:hypothetical protein
LLHDIQARTVAALPRILNELKARGYHIVHVVPATAERPATPTEPEQWRSHPENGAIAQWPKIPHFIFADAGALPAPSLSDFDLLDAQPIALAGPFDRSRSPAQGVALPRETPWPQHSELPLERAAATLPAPSRSLFDMPDGLHVIPHSATSSRHAEQAGSGEHETHAKVVSADTGGSRHLTREKRRLGRHRHHGTCDAESLIGSDGIRTKALYFF